MSMWQDAPDGSNRTLRMKYDAIIIGGGFAGLAAATYLARARRSVLVVDTGRPRNRFAAASHGSLGHEGTNPLKILAAARDQFLAYRAAHIVEVAASAAHVHEDGFSVRLENDEQVEARKLVLAFGLQDNLPDIPGLQERWGKTVLNCPTFHRIGFSGRELGVLYRVPMSVHQALLVAEWGPTTLYLNGATLEESEAAKLALRGVTVEAARVNKLIGDGAALAAVQLEGRRPRAIDAFYILPQPCLSSPLGDQLGVDMDDGPLGPLIRTDANKMTSIPGLYAAGDIAQVSHSVSWAVADGVTAGTSAHQALVFG